MNRRSLYNYCRRATRTHRTLFVITTNVKLQSSNIRIQWQSWGQVKCDAVVAVMRWMAHPVPIGIVLQSKLCVSYSYLRQHKSANASGFWTILNANPNCEGCTHICSETKTFRLIFSNEVVVRGISFGTWLEFAKTADPCTAC